MEVGLPALDLLGYLAAGTEEEKISYIVDAILAMHNN
jgi:hypothetical protein